MGGVVPAVQRDEQPPRMRRIFIGDIQGCREELEELLEKVRFDPAGDELHPVGDLVNRGPDSLGTLRLLRSLGAGGVLGNHDLHLLAVAAGERAPRPGDSLEALLEADDTAPLLEWLASRPFTSRHNSNNTPRAMGTPFCWFLAVGRANRGSPRSDSTGPTSAHCSRRW